MIIINVGVFLILSIAGNTEDAVFMLLHGAMYEPAVTQDHEFYRIFTSMFMHFGIDHLLNNMVLLGALGWNLESETGKVRFVIIYLISGLGGNLLSLYHGVAAETYAVSAAVHDLFLFRAERVGIRRINRGEIRVEQLIFFPVQSNRPLLIIDPVQERPFLEMEGFLPRVRSQPLENSRLRTDN